MSMPSLKAPKGEQHIALIFVGLITAMLLASLSSTIFSIALPTIVGELDGVSHMLWVSTAYILGSTIVMPLYGKAGDLIGRKSLLIAAIALFMVGSVVGALANGMAELIVGRAIQGLGGGGLMILSTAIIAEVVPARERGRYVGIMGGVFAFSSVAGPLLGGWFTESLGWRWCLWINIPLGLIAIASALAFLHLPHREREKRPIDFTGMTLLAAVSTAIVLITVWGGSTYAWSSTTILGLIAFSVIGAIAFVAVERRAAEPVMPLMLFSKLNFNLVTIAGLLIGVAMFGAIGYMPTYLQMVAGVDPTHAGFLMIPMMGGLLVTSVLAGQFVTRTGRYKWLPIIGSAFVAVSLGLLSTMSATNPIWMVCVYLGVMGIGLGMSMQILVLVVQNTFPIRMVGTATASNNYFRQIGASLGAGVVGSLFTTRLVSLLTERLSGLGDASGGAGDLNALTPDAVKQLPDAVREVIVASYNDALAPVFLIMLPLAVIAGILLVFVREVPLKTTIDEGEALVETLGVEHASLAELEAEAHTSELAMVGARVSGAVAADAGEGSEGTLANARRTKR
ncbi:MAG: MFS transporter [Demequina sp.]|jgi:EmrB/QacA subfamily drug resistance transporter|nr:MFS transporter [Demequina sp.]